MAGKERERGRERWKEREGSWELRPEKSAIREKGRGVGGGG